MDDKRIELCVVCQKPIPKERKRRHAKYCSDECSKQKTRGYYRENNPPLGLKLSTGVVGTINELRVCVDLLLKGYEVFRSVSSMCSCDLAILKDGKLLRLEVKTGYYLTNMKLGKPQIRGQKFDILAIVTRDKIHYQPEEF